MNNDLDLYKYIIPDLSKYDKQKHVNINKAEDYHKYLISQQKSDINSNPYFAINNSTSNQDFLDSKIPNTMLWDQYVAMGSQIYPKISLPSKQPSPIFTAYDLMKKTINDSNDQSDEKAYDIMHSLESFKNLHALLSEKPEVVDRDLQHNEFYQEHLKELVPSDIPSEFADDSGQSRMSGFDQTLSYIEDPDQASTSSRLYETPTGYFSHQPSQSIQYPDTRVLTEDYQSTKYSTPTDTGIGPIFNIPIAINPDYKTDLKSGDFLIYKDRSVKRITEIQEPTGKKILPTVYCEDSTYFNIGKNFPRDFKLVNFNKSTPSTIFTRQLLNFDLDPVTRDLFFDKLRINAEEPVAP